MRDEGDELREERLRTEASQPEMQPGPKMHMLCTTDGWGETTGARSAYQKP